MRLFLNHISVDKCIKTCLDMNLNSCNSESNNICVSNCFFELNVNGYNNNIFTTTPISSPGFYLLIPLRLFNVQLFVKISTQFELNISKNVFDDHTCNTHLQHLYHT